MIHLVRGQSSGYWRYHILQSYLKVFDKGSFPMVPLNSAVYMHESPHIQSICGVMYVEVMIERICQETPMTPRDNSKGIFPIQ